MMALLRMVWMATLVGSIAGFDTYCVASPVERRTIEAKPGDFVVLPCRSRKGSHLVWAKCQSEVTELLIYKSGKFLEDVNLTVKANGSVVLPYAKQGLSGEYRCYRVHGDVRILIEIIDLHVKEKSIPVWYIILGIAGIIGVPVLLYIVAKRTCCKAFDSKSDAATTDMALAPCECSRLVNTDEGIPDTDTSDSKSDAAPTVVASAPNVVIENSMAMNDGTAGY